MKSILYIAVFFACTAHFSVAQTDSHFTLSLRSGLCEIPYQSFNLEPAREELVDHTFIRLIRFSSLPTPHQQVRLANAGIYVLDYLSNNTYLCRLHTAFDRRFFEDLDLSAIVPLKASYRQAPSLQDALLSGEPLLLLLTPDGLPAFQSFTHRFGFEEWKIRVEQPYPIIEMDRAPVFFEKLIHAPFVLFAEAAPPALSAEDTRANAVHGLHPLSTPGMAPSLTGAGVRIAIGDLDFDGSHIDFAGRVVQNQSLQTENHTHAEMVAGILAGAGNLNPAYRGVAPGALLYFLPPSEIINQTAALLEDEVVITSTSYGDGCNRGYTALTQLADRQIFDHPQLIHVFSAGNSGTKDCNYGAGSGWGNITGGIKSGKNSITVGNIDFTRQIVATSSRGPTPDGRLKPDLCAVGDGQIAPASNPWYQEASGSSAAAPNVAGTLALLYEAYRSAYGEHPPSALLKALLLNTATDLGTPGPDFIHGFGQLNAYKAHHALVEEHYFAGTLAATQDQEVFQLEVSDDVQELKVLLYWADYPGSPLSNKALVNDLDLKVITPEGNILYPRYAAPSTAPLALSNPSQQGIDRINNVEQVCLTHPPIGTYTFIISGFAIPKGPQPFYVTHQEEGDELFLAYPYSNDALTPGEETTICWQARPGLHPFELSYRHEGNWHSIGTANASDREMSWTVPSNLNGKIDIRLSRNNASTLAEHISVWQAPDDLQVIQVCPGYLQLKWPEVENTDYYDLFQLQGNKMVQILSVLNQTSAQIPILDPTTEKWFAVQAGTESGVTSRRSLAVSSGIGLLNCQPDHDLTLAGITAPQSTYIPTCFSDSIPLVVNIHNSGTQMQAGFKIHYQIDEGETFSFDYPNPIPPNLVTSFDFPQSLSISTPGVYDIKIWTDLSTDEAPYNDTLVFPLVIVDGSKKSLPFFETFEQMDLCQNGVYTPCHTLCTLAKGWRNVQGGDQIDWRVHQGKTSSSQSGPEQDQNTGQGQGRYIYLEGSGGCVQNTAQVLSPCIDLGDAFMPVLSFWHHLYGVDIGYLHVDLFDGQKWYYNIIAPLVGNQGNQWKKATVNLTAFAGSTILLRFEGKTGDGHQTDMALDNIAILDASSPPVSAFHADVQQTCIGERVQLFDNSYNAPSNRIWQITPADFLFVDGTNANSPAPVLRFQASGNYQVSLQTINAFGSDTKVSVSDFFTISNGISLPFIENFEDPNGPLAHWQLQNPDENITWETTGVIGTDGEPNTAVFMNNHSYNASGEQDEVTSDIINLGLAAHPELRFDLSYAQFNEDYSDALQVLLSTDCGVTFDQVIYHKSGANLSTVNSATFGWEPTARTHWRTEIVDLSAYQNQSIALKFVNTTGYGNNLYLDNIRIADQSEFPTAFFQIDTEDGAVCIDDSISLFIPSNGAQPTYLWTIQEEGKAPKQITGAGPHSISFTAAGTASIDLNVCNHLGCNNFKRQLKIIESPVAFFEATQSGGNLIFENLSTPSHPGTTYWWEFGDGQSSTDTDPIHAYAANQSVLVRLTVTNACGTSTYERTFGITTNTHEPKGNDQIHLYPNPTTAHLSIDYTVSSPMQQWRLYDLRGRLIQKVELNHTRRPLQLDVSNLPSGLYLIVLQLREGQISQKFIKK